MVVTNVAPLDKKRSRVWLDGEFAFVLYKGELRTFKIEEGRELAEKEFDEIMKVTLPKRAKLRAMNLLKSHTYSVKQLRDKLEAGEYPKQVIDAALEYVASYGYTDDLRLSEEYVRIHLADKSRQRITQDLYRKGVSTEVIAKAFDNCADYGFEQDETEMVKALLKKRKFNPNAEYSSHEEKIREYAKLYSYLARKGYSASVIRSAMGGFDEYE